MESLGVIIGLVATLLLVGVAILITIKFRGILSGRPGGQAGDNSCPSISDHPNPIVSGLAGDDLTEMEPQCKLIE